MSTKVHRVDWRADNFLVGTSMLGPTEGWLYTVVINLIYSHGEAIDADIAWLSHITRMHGNAVRAALKRLADLGKVWEKDGKLMAKRCENELETARKRMRSASENGGKGGRPSNKNNEVDKPNGLRDAKATNTNTNTNTSGSTDTDVSSEPPDKKRALSRDAMFDVWWRGYPHKVGKGAARAKFDIAIRGGVELDTLVAGGERYKRTKPPDHNWLNPATWLFQQRWLDEPATNLVVVGETTEEPPPSEADIWRGRLAWSGKHDGRWLAEKWGPPPTDPGCEAPEDLLSEFGYRPKQDTGR